MRWDELFADLEGRARALEDAEQQAEIAERTRAEVAQVAFVNRLRAHTGAGLRVSVTGAGQVVGQLERVGKDWLLLSTPEEAIIPVSAVAAAFDLPSSATSPEGVAVTEGRLSLTTVLRAVAVDRSQVAFRLRDGSLLTGTPQRVGADFVDLVLHDLDEAPRRAQRRPQVTVPFHAVAVVRRQRSQWD